MFVTPALSNESAYWHRASELIKSKNYAEALVEANRVLAEKPDDLVMLRVKGISLLELDRQDDAVEVLRRAVEKDPNSIASRYYLGQALAYRGSMVEAIQTLKTVQSMAPDSLYAQRAAQVLPELQSLRSAGEIFQDQKRWNLVARSSVEYDTNVPARSRHENGNPPQESFRFIPSVYMEYRMLDEKIDKTAITLGAGYAFYYSAHTRAKLDIFNLLSQTPRLFIRKSGQVGKFPYTIGVQADYSYTHLGHKFYGHQASLSPSLQLQWAPWAVFAPSYNVTWKNFKNDSTQPWLYSRDGNNQSIDFGNYFYLLKNKLIWGVSYTLGWDNPEGSQFDQINNSIGTSVQMALPWKLRLTGALRYQDENYFDFTPSPARLDDVITVSCGISRPFFNNKIVPELTYLHTRADSTQNFSEYRRDIFGLAINYYF